jgi:hypothetical protein
MRAFKPLRCLLLSNGKPCGRYLADLEAGVPVTIRFTCPGKHDDGHNRIEFSQDDKGVLFYTPLHKGEKKLYVDDGVRVSK